jgi:KDO2-lipid IV(A) lauroyltransferase
MDRYFLVEGLEHLRAAMREGNGVVLVSYHGSSNRFANAALSRWVNGRDIPTLGQSYGVQLARRIRSSRKQRMHREAILANVALEGRRILREGGIVTVVPDIGYDATEGVPLAIGGFRFLIKPGFAELALTADSAVVPFYSTRRSDGRIVIRFHTSFDPGSPSADRAARMDRLLRQYGTFVETAWTQAPESLL